ncbi:hypothetical protein DFR29_10839 [Tahibacter aquaticus]|uniref:Uncharacterized protein n=1 Tax=Tahibacter aquaticus TaxID=520092 RepID=A0A4V6PYC3_9GAMM|nr:hypothetical protein [Tahibacter aquaticus]TDR42456.1 hypothetical protein DFR29_10839 [Tahibacter aquaticus]
MRKWTGLLLWVLAAPAWCVPAWSANLAVYDEALQNGFDNYSYGGGATFGSNEQAHSGTLSIRFAGGNGQPNNFNALSFFHDPDLSTAAYPSLRFWVHGGAAGGQQLRLYLQHNDVIVAQAELDAYISGGALVAGAWREVVVPLTSGALNYNGAFDRIDLQSDSAVAQPVLYIDDIVLAEPVVLPADAIFRNGFESSSLPPAANGLVQEQGVSVLGMTSDRFTWRDSANQPRVAVLAHNTGQSGPNGSRGGELREFRYQVGGNTRVVGASNSSGASGFGYVVSHRSEGSTGIGTDDSPLGHGFTGQLQRVWTGRHHAIFRFSQNYPRWSTTTAVPPNTRYDVPVTLDWVFASGHDFPLWAISWDLSATPADAIEADSRAPYGELLFDGAATPGAHSTIAGIGWGDRYKFQTTSSPATYSSSWSWNTPNTIPYVKLWTTAVDATMGTVQTQPIAQQDAGGYFGTSRWNSTSAAGNACTSPASLMPCDYNWPYQSINYSFGGVNTPTNNTRLAWGTNFGFLGQTSYYVHGSAYWGGPLPNATAAGWPRKSYSTHIVLGTHSTDPVGAQVGQVETMQSLTATASIGSVATSGPAGAGRVDTIAYAPAGYDPVYAAVTFNAAGNALDANIAVGSGTLRKPLLVVRGVTAYPATLRFNGAVLVLDVDYFPSLRSSPNEIWITLNRDLSGAANRVELLP